MDGVSLRVRIMERFKNWGATSQEIEALYPCDQILPNPDESYYRAITVQAPKSIAFRWLCQLKYAPYSYDWIDNLGRKSPETLTPGAENLEIGQRVMTIFRLAAFEGEEHLTLELDWARALFGAWAISYTITSPDESTSRYVVKLNVRYPRGVWGWILSRTIPLGDWVMMRKQLNTLKALCERDSKRSVI